MDLSRLKKALAGVSVAAISASQFAVPALAAGYTDVPSGVWFEESVMKFVEDGLLDAAQTRFRGGDNATRSEFVKLLVMMNGGLLSTPPAVGSFVDVPTSAWFYAYMEEAAKEGWVKGDGNCYGTKPCYARPGANVNRAEAAALIVRAFGLEGTGDAPAFSDVPSSAWYADAVQTAADYCVVQGNNGWVRPSDNMNRAEMVVMLHRVDQGLTYGVDCGTDMQAEWGIDSVMATGLRTVEVVFSGAVDQTTAEMASRYSITGATPAVTVTSAKLVSDDTVELTVSGDLSSGEFTLTVTDMENTDGDVFSDSGDFDAYSTLPTSNGTLQVAVASKNPVGDTVPKGANGVTLLSLDLTASCDDSVTVEDLTVLKEGFGDENDITGVYASWNGGRISRKRTIDSKDQTARIHFTKPLTVPACKTMTVDLMADFATSAAVAAEHNLAVELTTDVMSNSKQTTGNFPLRGNTFRMGAVTSGTLTLTYRSVTPNEVEVSNKDVVLGRFEVSASTVEDTTLYSVTVQQDGSAKDGDITNLKIRRTDGTVISNVVSQTVGDYATFVFDPPFTVLEGSKITLEIVGDVVGGAGNNVKLIVEETGDVFAVGSLYGYGVNGQLYGSQVVITAPSGLPAVVTIDAGQFTIEIDGPVQQRYNRDQDDANLANVIMTPGDEQIDIRKLYVLVQGFTSTGTPLDGVNATFAGAQSGSYDDINEVINNVELRDKVTGRTVTGVRITDSTGLGKVSSVGTYQVYRFDDFTVKGKSTYEFRVDFVDNGSSNHPLDGDQFRVHICGEPTERNNTTNATGCNFGGAYPSTVTTFQMQIEGLSSTDKVQDVRPGGTITGNIHRISSANMTVAVKPLLSADTTVKNAKNVTLLRFENRAGEAKDVLFTKAVFVAATGNLQNGQNYSLWADSDSDGTVDTIVEEGVTSQSSKITFAKFKGGGFVIPKEKTVVFEVHSNIAASPTSSTLQLAFDTSATDYVEAEQVDRGTSLSGIRTNGTCSVTSCDITVTTVASTLFTIVNQGNLYVSKDDAVNLRSMQLLGGTVSDTTLRLNLRAEYEDIDVYSLQFTSSGATADSVDSLDLYADDKTTPFATARIADCGSDDVLLVNRDVAVRTFCAKMQNSQLVVPKGKDMKLLVKPRLKSDEAGALSNETVQFMVTGQAVFNNTTGSGAVRARGRQSSNDLIANNGNVSADGEVFLGRTAAATTNRDIDGIKNVSVLSKIRSITNAGQASNVVPVDTSDIGWFTFTAATNVNSKNGLNKATLSGVVFNVTATNVTLDPATFVVYTDNNPSVNKACVAKLTSGTVIAGTASGSFAVQCDRLNDGTSLASITQGGSKTLVLRAKVLNPKVLSTSTSTLQVSLQNFDSMTRTTYGVGSNDSHIEWVDEDSGAIGTTSGVFRWIEYGETTIKSTSFTQ